ncbi:MAG: hypothetical protein OD815_001290 [Candidatus Alkanophagales archaeon MCA70_species_2]|nr:hypothetical protein [Candidatus Alkanophaga liquidiphilum]
MINIPVARNSPHRIGAIALGQQEDMWLRYAPLKFAIANFTYSQTSHIPGTLYAIVKINVAKSNKGRRK